MDSKQPTALAFDGLVKRYRRHTVLDGFCLSVRQGECFGLVGVNGAGKTTCIKGLLDFCEIDGGTISIFDVPHTETRARSRVAYLPERFLPPYYLTGRDFLRYMSRLHGTVYDESAAFELCGQLDLDPDALAKPAREYSKGMAQKLGLVSCFMYARDLVVLDEPMSGSGPEGPDPGEALLWRSSRRRDGRCLSARTCFPMSKSFATGWGCCTPSSCALSAPPRTVVTGLGPKSWSRPISLVSRATSSLRSSWPPGSRPRLLSKHQVRPCLFAFLAD